MINVQVIDDKTVEEAAPVLKETKEQTNKDSLENTEDYEQISIFDDLD